MKAVIGMDFIEQWFHVSPDGGNGSLEVLYIVAIVAVILMVLFRHRLGELIGRAAQRSTNHDGDRPTR
jgi:hypothetical protein